MLRSALTKRTRPPAAPPTATAWLYRSSNLPPSSCRPSPASTTPLSVPIQARTFSQAPPRSARAASKTTEADAKLVERTKADEVVGNDEPSSLPQGIKLRPYQAECIRAVLDELERGEYQRLGVSAPTGSGKTAIFTSLIRYLPPLIHPVTGEHATRVLIVVNSIQLAAQTAAVVRRTYPEMSVEVEQGVKKGTGMAEVTVATYQTLARGDLSRLDKFDPDSFKAVIVDEAHHAVAPSYLSILARFDSHILSTLTDISLTGLDTTIPAASPVAPASAPSSPPLAAEDDPSLSELDDPSPLPSELPSEPSPPSSSSLTSEDPNDTPEDADLIPTPVPREAVLDSEGRHRVPLLAFSATWGRADGLALGKVWEKIVHHTEWLDMIEANWLSPLQFTTVHLGSALDMSQIDVSATTGEFNMASLAKAVDKSEVNRVAVDAWEAKAGDRRSTLVFAVNIDHVVSLTNEFRARGYDARFVYEATKPKEREELYEQFRAGEFPILVNCGILTEGADFPAIDCVLLARPTRSQNLFLQMLGRGLRLSPETGKKDCLLIDLVGNSTSAGGVVCTPTLFGLDPDEKVEGLSTSDLQERGLERALTRPPPSSSDSTTTTITDSSNPIRKLSSATFSKRHSFHYRDYETAFDLVEQEHQKGRKGGKKGGGEAGPSYVPVSRLSRLAWVGCGDDTWVLELMGIGHVKVARENENYVAYHYRRLAPAPSSSPYPHRGPRYTHPVAIASHRSLPILLRTVDAFVLSKPENGGASLARYAPWRKAQASEAQKKFVLKKLGKDVEVAEDGSGGAEGGGGGGETIEGVWVGRPYKEQVPIAGLTKGQAADILARTMHGGLKFWRDSRKVLVREEKKAVKEREKVEKRMLSRIKGVKLTSKAAE
ncbi:hypothetical protein JCM6882_003888 [Rhodosporidiobolus microsporus]